MAARRLVLQVPQQRRLVFDGCAAALATSETAAAVEELVVVVGV